MTAVLSRPQRSAVIGIPVKRRILIHQRFQILHNADLRKLVKILSQHHEHIRLLSAQKLSGKPFRVILLADTAVIMHPHTGMLRLEFLHGLVYNHIAVGIGNIPVASGKNPHLQNLVKPSFIPTNQYARCAQNHQRENNSRQYFFVPYQFLHTQFLRFPSLPPHTRTVAFTPLLRIPVADSVLHRPDRKLRPVSQFQLI